jgi:hypothetical protein
LVTDVVTHWWSTHDMVQRLTQLQPSLATLFAEADEVGLGKITPLEAKLRLG